MGSEIVRDFMTTEIQTAGVNDSLAHALDIMTEFNIRHLPVLERGKLAGIVSQRDLFFQEGFRVDPERSRVSEAMTPDPYTVGPDAGLEEVAATMATRKYGAAVVVEADKAVGIFTTTDALRALVDLVGRLRASGPVMTAASPTPPTGSARRSTARRATR